MLRFFRRSSRARGPSLPSRIELEVREEIRFYLEMRAEELRREGVAADEAWRRAVEAFGDPDAVVGAVVGEHEDRGQGRRGVGDMTDGILQDIRYGLRNLRQAPGFTAAAVLTLALGVGATSAIFSVVSGVVLRPLPFPEPDELVAINSRWNAESGYEWDRYPVGSPEYFDYIAQNKSMAFVSAVSTARLTFRPDGADPRMVTAGVVSPSMFATLQVPPLLGRTLMEEDGGPRPAAVVVLAHDFWLREMGGDSSVVGRALELGWETEGNEVSSIVVGVMPAGFAFPDPDVEMWAPLLLDPARTWRGGHWFTMVARLAPGTTLRQAKTEMEGMMARWRDDYPDHHRGHFLYIAPLLDELVADVRPTLLLLFGAVGFVLLIACANVASLLLARGSYRRRELAVRSALGAGRLRLVRQLLTEALLLALSGGLLGLALSAVGVDALLALEGGQLPRGEGVGMDWRVLGFTGLTVAVTTLVVGLLPAHQSSSTDLARSFSEGGRWASGGRDRLHLRKTLVIAEVSLALVLLVGAGLMAKSFWVTLRQDPGFETAGLLSVGLTFPEARYTAARKVEFMTRLAERTEGMPGVEHAGIVSRPPLAYDNSMTRFVIEGRPELEPGEDGPTGSHVMASRGALDVLGVRAVRGRLFDRTDVVDGPPVALIDEVMAQRYWPGEDPIGSRIRFGATDGEMRTIVGIVTPVKFDGLTVQAPTFYEPESQAVRLTPFHLGSMTLLVRMAGDPLTLAGSVRDAVRVLDPGLPIVSVRTMEDLLGSALTRPRFLFTLLATFALLALSLGAIGIYGVVAQTVAHRTNEIGIRRALGAGAEEVRAMVVGQGMTLVAAGIVLGLAAALLVNRVLSGFLFQVSTTDALTYVLVAAAVAAVAAVATVLPARRATRIDPVEALRAD
ncbi:MAG TPA: ABC transporter permease [Longimicrobiales bacterium]|nr:ABC transporter permease [Longimicrobiales bacterium]